MFLYSSFVACPCFPSCTLPLDVGTTTVLGSLINLLIFLHLKQAALKGPYRPPSFPEPLGPSELLLKESHLPVP